MATAHTVSSLLNDELFSVPSWTVMAQKLVIVFIGLYLMFLLPRFRITTGFVISVLILIGLINTHFILMISESIWLPWNYQKQTSYWHSHFIHRDKLIRRLKNTVSVTWMHQF